MMIGTIPLSLLSAKTSKEYQYEIENKSKELTDLQKSLAKKKAQQAVFVKTESQIKKELSALARELSNLSAESEKVRKGIRSAEKNLKTAEKNLSLAGWEKQQWNEAYNTELNRWFRAHYAVPYLYADPAIERFRVDALNQKRGLYTGAQQRESVSYQNLKSWKAAKTKLEVLRKEKNKTALKQKAAQKKKAALLTTTAGKRVAAEQEIKDIESSATALQGLLKKLETAKKKSEADIQRKAAFTKKINTLPWPVKGTVTTAFGKNKHPQLDTVVISNGIKIRTQPHASVQAVSDGDVLYSGMFRVYGLMVIVDHGGGFYTVYGQLGEVVVDEGKKVKAGEAVGTVSSDDPILYFEVRSGSVPQDPLLWLK